MEEKEGPISYVITIAHKIHLGSWELQSKIVYLDIVEWVLDFFSFCKEVEFELNKMCERTVSLG